MAQVINTNSLSLITQNNINKNQSALSSSIERLSSGLRINSAKDDAAGQAIANRFTSNIKGLTQAARNANDGISLAQTTEGALSEINNNLQRVRELTVQATTGTNSDSDLSSIQDEIKSRLDEIDRVSGQTQFNGVNVLAKDGTMKIQVGANDGQTISIDLQKIDSSTLNLKGFSVSSNALKVSDAITSVPGATAGSAPIAVTFGADADGAAAIAKTLGVADTSGLSLHNVLDSKGDATGTYVIQSGSNSYSASLDSATGKVTLNTTNVTYNDPASGITGATQTAQPIKVSTNANGEAVGVVTVQGKNYLAGATGTGKDAIANSGTTTPTSVATTIQLSAQAAVAAIPETSPGEGDAVAAVPGIEATAEFKGAATNDPLALLDKAIASVDKFRSSLGAVQNRLSSAVTNLNNTTTNLSEAQSRIQDADYATEVSNMSKAQIVQQAGNSVLSKANQVPQQVLSLLQG
ncbi:flagellin [Enterobacter hormaechei]